MTTPVAGSGLAQWQFDEYVSADVDRHATPEQLAVLEANPMEWRAALLHLLHSTEEHLQHARRITGEERAQVLADLEHEYRQLRAAWLRLNPSEQRPDDDTDTDDLEPGRTQLQASWEPGRVVAWAAGPGAPVADRNEVLAMLAATGAPDSGWTSHPAVPLPGGGTADAVSIPVGDVLGWLVAAGADQLDDTVGPSLRWLGQVAVWAVELTMHGAMVPQLRRRTRRHGGANNSSGSFSVRWTPALVDTARLARSAETMPGAVLALDRKVDRRALTRSALTGMIDAICRKAASSVTVPAPPPHVRTATDVAEAFLGRLDGTAFDGPLGMTDKIVTRVERWARAVTGQHPRLIVQLAADRKSVV